MTGKKLDNGKPPIVQGCFNYFPKALLEVSKVSKYGTEKYNLNYADRNYLRVENGVVRYTDALGRHLLDEQVVGPIDLESNCLNAAMVAWNALARLEIMLNERDNG